MSGTIKIHGKEYKPVAMRVNEFIAAWPGGSIQTEIVSNVDDTIIMKATVLDESGKVRGTGYAEEVRGSTNINKTSALENCETSAIGRALACVGFAGSEYASANEVSDAVIRQAEIRGAQILIDQMRVLRPRLTAIDNLKGFIDIGDLSAAKEEWLALTEEEQRALWVAETRGGVLTTKERETMKSTEWREA